MSNKIFFSSIVLASTAVLGLVWFGSKIDLSFAESVKLLITGVYESTATFPTPIHIQLFVALTLVLSVLLLYRKFSSDLVKVAIFSISPIIVTELILFVSRTISNKLFTDPDQKFIEVADFFLYTFQTNEFSPLVTVDFRDIVITFVITVITCLAIYFYSRQTRR